VNSKRLVRTALAAAVIVALGSAYAAGNHLQSVPAQAATPSLLSDAVISDNSLLLLRTGIVDPSKQRIDFTATGVPNVDSTRFAIVQFNPGDTRAIRSELAKQGLEFVDYIPNNAYIVRLNGASLDKIRSNPNVRWAGAHSTGMKVSPELWVAERAALTASQASFVELELIAFRGERASHIADAIGKRVPQALVTNRNEARANGDRIRVSIETSQLDELLQAASTIEGVAWIEQYVEPVTANSGDPGTLQGNLTAACSGSGAVCGNTPIWAQDIYGTGQIVSVCDTGLDSNEAWFTTLDKGAGPVTAITLAEEPALPNIGSVFMDRKVMAYWVQPGATAHDYSSGHGTHVAGTVAGDAAGTFGTNTYVASTPTSAGHELADGNAPNAQLMIQDIGTAGTLTGLNDLYGTLQQARNGGALLHTNSWGAPIGGQYNANSGNVDHFTNQHDDFLFIVAAGNNGPTATTIGAPATAKNALTVGGTSHGGSTAMYNSSSRGPTVDGRIKPDIMAPAVSIVSASADTNTNLTPEAPATTSKSGTSMATPAIAGVAALTRQFFTDGFYPRGERTAADTHTPSGAMLKAVLVNGTNPLSVAANNWPDMNYGWGRAWLDSNLWFKNTLGGGDDSRRMRLFEKPNIAGLRAGEVDTYTINSVDAGAELRVTLTWYDPEAAPAAAVTLINNLDVEVEAPNGDVFKGNVFSGGVSQTGGSPDLRNTVEQVRIANPTAGRYTIRVKAASTPGNGRTETDYQGYALAVSGAFGLPDAAPLDAPTSLSISGNSTSGVAVSFNPIAGAQSYQLYRASGTCGSASAGDFRMVANSNTSTVTDTHTQGGFSYAYKVRAIGNDVEGKASDCIDVVSEDSCSLLPTFDGSTLISTGAFETCKVSLAWDAATSNCPTATGTTYSILRSENPYMTGAATIATNLPSTSFEDTTAVSGTTYYYSVNAVDSFGNATLPTQTAIVSATPTGPSGPNPLTFVDDVDTNSYMTRDSAWQITNTSASDGVFSYHSGPDNANYPDNTCASITTPELVVPPGGLLEFSAKYNLEYEWDGVVSEISTDGGATWSDLPPDSGYPSTYNTGSTGIINACGYPNGRGIYTGVTTATSNGASGNSTETAIFKPFSADLSAYAGQAVKIRWRLSSDPADNYIGFFLDGVKIGNADILFHNGFEESAYMCK
jgi:fibronectin type 3 domain-containing protein